MNENILALPAGTELNHYVVETVLGQGGFGVVYKAHHAHLEEQVVIKEFLPVELAGRQGTTVTPHGTSKQDVYSDCLRRFMEEGRTLVRLRHPNVVRCRDLFTANGTAYLVMDFEDGLPLDELIASLESQGQQYSETQMLHFLLPLADGLAYIHDQGVLHRDIKPANIFIRRSDGSPVIIDFGAAKQNFALASQSQAPYTEFYAPLEQIEGGGEAKPTIDIYAFGGLMYRIVTGKIGPKAEARAMALVYGKPDPLQSATSTKNYPMSFLETIDQCLAFKADERPQSMSEVKTRLQPGSEPSQNNKGAQVQASDLQQLDELLMLAGADSVINEDEMTMLLQKAERLGIAQVDAQQYIIQYAVGKGWQIETKQTADNGYTPSESATAFDEVFGDIFNEDKDGAKRGNDLRYDLNISLEEANSGKNAKIRVPSLATCKNCDGSGLTRGAQPKTCPSCKGVGRTENTKTLSVKIPAGVNTNDRIRLTGEGDDGSKGGESGDLYVNIALQPHRVFTVNEYDLSADVFLEEKEIKSNGSFTFEGLEGSLKVKLPKDYEIGKPIRLNGKGLLCGAHSKKRGHLFLSVYPNTDQQNVSKKPLPILIKVEANSPALANGILQENLGLETLGGVLTPLAQTGDSLLSGAVQIFSTAEDNQQAVSIKLFRGNYETVDKATYLGNFDISNIPPAKKGIPQIEVTLLAKNDDLYLQVCDQDGASLKLTSEERAQTTEEPPQTQSFSSKLGSFLLTSVIKIARIVWMIISVLALIGFVGIIGMAIADFF